MLDIAIFFEIMKGRKESKMKKTLAILLSLALMICMIPATAFANPTTITSESVVTLTLNKTSSTYTGEAQTPSVQSIKVDGGDIPQGYTYCVKWKKGSETATETVTNVGVYTAEVVFTNGSESSITLNSPVTFEIKAYDLSKVNILIDDQTETPADGANKELGKLQAGTVSYYYGGNPMSSTESAWLSGKVVLGLNNTDNNYTATFTVSEAYKNNFAGTISPTSFKVVNNINGTSVKIKNAAGNAEISTIEAGAYDGREKAVQTMFSIYDGDTLLKLGTHYTVTCADAKNATTSTVNVVVKGIGTYGGKKEIPLSITPRDSSNVTYDAVGDQTVGTLNSVDPVLRDKGLGTILKKGTDYLIKSRSGSPGTKGSVVIDFMGNYGGTDLNVQFNIVSDDKNVETLDVYYGNEKIDNTLKVFTPAYMYKNVSQPINGITVYIDYINKKTLSTYNYDVVYEYTEGGKTVSTTSPIDAKNYNVCIVGKNGYAGKKLIGTYKIPKFDIKNTTITVSAASATATPNVTVKSIYDNITFVKDKDYTVTSSSYVSNGKIWVTVTPKETGNLTGTARSDYYPVVAKSISSCRVYFTNGRSSASYTGSSIVVDVKVEDGYYNVLRERTDYTISYKLNGKEVYAIKDAGVYTIEIKGINGYTGTTSLTFTVVGTDISGYTVTLKESSVNATGYAQTPVILSVKKGVYSSLTSNDYTVTYQDATGKTVTSMSAPGTYKVVVTGKNGYSGSTYATFRIVGLPQTVTVNQDSYKVYTTSDSFKITAKATGDGTGFTYTSSNPAVASVSAAGYVTIHKVGRAVITVTTTGNKKYEPTSKDVTVKVYPSKAKISQKPSTDGKKAQMKVRWGYQDGVTKYQIRYSRDKNFKSGSYLTKTVKAHGKSYTTQSTTISNLKSGYTYYFKVRAVYTDPYTGDTYYGSWSPWRSAKTK